MNISLKTAVDRSRNVANDSGRVDVGRGRYAAYHRKHRRSSATPLFQPEENGALMEKRHHCSVPISIALSSAATRIANSASAVASLRAAKKISQLSLQRAGV